MLQIVVDLSNIVRDKSIAPVGVAASMERYEALLDALAGPEWGLTNVLPVADSSLFHHLSEPERRHLKSLVNDGEADQAPVADNRLLEVAVANDGVLVATNDNLTDHRREYAEIEDWSRRFVGWRSLDETGQIEIFFRDMGKIDGRELSRNEELKALGRAGLASAPIQERALLNWFRCESRSCLSGQMFPERLPMLPRYEPAAGRFVCDGCGSTLIEAGDRQPASQLIFLLAGEEQGPDLGRRGGCHWAWANRESTSDWLRPLGRCRAASRN